MEAVAFHISIVAAGAFVGGLAGWLLRGSRTVRLMLETEQPEGRSGEDVEVPERRVRTTLKDHLGPVQSVDFSPDGTQLASGGADGVVRIWDPVEGHCRMRLEAHPYGIRIVRFSPDGAWVASGAEDGTILLRPVRSGEPSRRLAHHTGMVMALAFSPDGRTLVSGGQDHRVVFWDFGSNEVLDSFPSANGTIRTLLWGPDDKTVLSGGWWRIEFWDAETRTRRSSIAIGRAVWELTLSPDRRFLAAGATPGALRVWDLTSTGAAHRLGGHEGFPVTTTARGRIVTGDRTGRMQVFRLGTGERLASIDAQFGRVRALSLSGDGSRLAAGNEERVVSVWDVDSGERLSLLKGFRPGNWGCVSLDADGSTVAFTHRGGGFRVRDVRTGELVSKLKRSSRQAISVSFSPDGQSLATTSRDLEVRLWSRSGELLAALECDANPWSARFSPDGGKVAAGTWRHEVWVWDVASRKRLVRLRGHSGVVWEVAFLPGSDRFLASGSGDGTVRIWDLKEQRSLAVIEAFEANVNSISFGDDGRTLIVSGEGPEVLVYDLDYYARHIAGNWEYQSQKLSADLGDAIQVEALQRWAEEVMSRPWPRLRWDRD